MDLKELKKIINLMKSSDVSEIELETDGNKVRIVRGSTQKDFSKLQSILQSISTSSPFSNSSKTSETEELPAIGEDKKLTGDECDDGNLEKITAPMVGTFYSASNPDNPAYVRVGDVVKKGDILCIIEAMKLMNEIESDVNGKVVSLFVKNAQPVEYGQPLFLVDPQ